MSQFFDLKKVADLAYLNVNEQDKKELLPKLQLVIEYIGKIQNLNLGEEELQEDFPQRVNFREDLAKQEPISIEKLSSFTEENYFVVPKVIQDLD